MNIPPQAYIIGVAIVVIGFIIFRKSSTLASIDTESIPKDVQSKLKKNLYADRLKRKLKERSKSLKLITVPLWEVIKKTASMSYKRVRELRTQYRLKKEQGQFPDSPNPAERDIIVEAEELFHEGKLKQAEEAYITIIEHNQKNIEAYEGLAEVYLKMKDFEHAEEILSYIVKLKEQFLPEDSNSKEKSEITNPKSGGEKSDLANHHFELGEVHYKNGEKAESLRCFKEAVRLDSKNPKYLDRLIETAIEQGNTLLARKTLDKLKTVNPENSKISEWNSKIESI